ncbi:MAG: CopG family transcriptional regulator [marine bacterium B5-7]|nr:MAG: CopG family transcriptional regulator [marine bacterium B5-7]
MIKTKKFIGIIVSVFISALGGFILMQSASAEPEMTVYKSATCGCCNKWIEHMEDNGFQVNAVDVLDVNLLKQQYGISYEHASCHTAVVDGYVIEGHVPALDVKRLLSEKPDVLGLSVPGMPVGSPGMEMGDRVDHYSVIAMDKEGNARVFNQY